MAFTFQTPNLNLTLPVVTQQIDPAWAQNINNAFIQLDTIFDLPLPASYININGDLSFNTFNATNVRALRLINMSGVPVSATDVGEIVNVNGNLTWINAAGVAVTVTTGSTVNSAGVTASQWTQKNVSGTYTISASDTYGVYQVATNAIAATINLPPAAAVAQGILYLISDYSGNASNRNITIVANTSNNDTINGLASITINTNFGSAWLECNLSANPGAWTLVQPDLNNLVGNTIIASTGTLTLQSTGNMTLQASGSNVINLLSTILFGSAVSPVITQTTLASGTGASMELVAQSSTAGDGGALFLSSGQGGSGNGILYLQTGESARVIITDTSVTLEPSVNLVVGGNTTLDGNLTVDGNATIDTNLAVVGTLVVGGTATFDVGVGIADNLTISGNLLLGGTSSLAETVSFGSDANITGNLHLQGELLAPFGSGYALQYGTAFLTVASGASHTLTASEYCNPNIYLNTATYTADTTLTFPAIPGTWTLFVNAITISVAGNIKLIVPGQYNANIYDFSLPYDIGSFTITNFTNGVTVVTLNIVAE